MQERVLTTFGITAVLAVGVAIGAQLQSGHLVAVPAAHAAPGAGGGPAGEVPDRYVYYPGTEALAEGEVRVIACGTGMPDQRIA